MTMIKDYYNPKYLDTFTPITNIDWFVKKQWLEQKQKYKDEAFIKKIKVVVNENKNIT